MKILIIEDNREAALNMQQILHEFGDIRICTKPDLVEMNFDFDKMKMPSKLSVLEEIKWAEIILLDDNLNADYTGRRLLQFCADKKVIGISNGHDLGEVNFSGKGSLHLKHVQERLKKMVKSFCIPQ